MGFDMTAQQVQAFKDATGGVAATSYNHFVAILIGILATVWLFWICVGTLIALRNHQVEVGDALLKWGMSLMIFIMVGAIIL